MRVLITLACTECKQRNYQTNKNKKNDPDRIEIKKYCNSAFDSFMNPVTFPTVLISLVEAVSGTVIISHPCYPDTSKLRIIWFLYG